jgi:NAD(P)-dependent dehydrogenase (short-subunit alcohol dehydrogenase family)
LESWLAGGGRTATALERLTATFHRGVLLGETVHAIVENEGEEFTVKIYRGEAKMASIRGRRGALVAYPEPLPADGDRRDCRVLDSATIVQASGSLPLWHCEAEACRLFPELSAALPPVQFAAILATTRLVGMECPGLHSFYSTMKLSFAREASGPPRMNFRVTATDRFGGVRLAVDGPGLQGELGAFLRPPPRAQASVRELAQMVEAGEFSQQRAVIVGGSRGLGEVAAKLLASGGADVTITYRVGKEDAEAVATEIAAEGGRCTAVQFDCGHPAPIETAEPPEYLYYFASPHIGSDQGTVFSQERFAEYCRHYVTNFANTLLLFARGAPALNVFYPSTVFLDDAGANLPEYCAAKAAGEELCRQMALRFPSWRIYAPRLPRMATDQNNGLLPAEMEAPERVLLRHLRRQREGAAV